MRRRTLEHIRAPVLAIDVSRAAVRALYHLPGGPEREPRAFQAPFPDAPAGRPQNESARIPGYDPRFWAGLCELSGLPPAEVVLVSAVEGDSAPGGEEGDRNAVVRRLFAGTDALSLDSLMPELPDAGLLRLSAIRSMTGFPAIDVSRAFILGLTALPDIAERSYRQGLALLHLHRRGLLAALLFQERVHAFLRLPLDPDAACGSAGVSLSGLPGMLEDFRLGWLPGETAAGAGGFVWRTPELPPEAEGFAPFYAVGSHAHLMRGRACVLGEDGTGPFNNCRGLLYGYNRLLGRAKA